MNGSDHATGVRFENIPTQYEQPLTYNEITALLYRFRRTRNAPGSWWKSYLTTGSTMFGLLTSDVDVCRIVGLLTANRAFVGR